MEKSIKELAEEALLVQNACNLCAVAQGFARAMLQMHRHGIAGRDLWQHPISVMWSSKIASLTDSDDVTMFSRALGECELLAQGRDI